MLRAFASILIHFIIAMEAESAFSATPRALLDGVTTTLAGDGGCVTVISDAASSYSPSADTFVPHYAFSTETPIKGRALTAAGKQCPKHLFVFQVPANLMAFLDEYWPHLRRSGASYVVVVSEAMPSKATADEIFSHGHMNKVLHAALFLPLHDSDEFIFYHKTPCDNEKAIIGGVWTSKAGLGTYPLFDMHLLKDLSCRHIKATAFDYPPSTTITELSDGSRKYGGFEFRIFDAIADHLSFDYTIAPPAVCCVWGLPTDDGKNYTGLVGDLFNGFSDIGWADLFIRDERRALFDYTDANSFHFTKFLLKRPNALPLWTAPLQPFTEYTWIAALLTCLTCILFFLFYNWAHPECPYKDNGRLALRVYGSFLERGLDELKIKADGLRTFVAIYIFAFFALTTAYKGGLVSNLSFPKVPKPIDTLKELAESDLSAGSYDCEFAGLSPGIDPNWDDISDKCDNIGGAEQKSWDNVEKGAEARMEASLFLRYKQRELFTNRYGETSVHITSQPVRVFMGAYGLQKDSIFTAKFSGVISRLIEAGLSEKWLSDEMDNVAKITERRTQDEPKAFVLEQVQGALFIIVLGLGQSAIAFAVEVMCGAGRPEERQKDAVKEWVQRRQHSY